MFEHETEAIVRAVRENVFRPGGETIAVKDILASNIPHPIKNFFRADVEAMLLRELSQFHKSSSFDFNHPEVRALQQQMNSTLVLHYSFKRPEFEQRLNDAIHMIINYLVRPQWTLASVLFEKDNPISTQTLAGMLRYFGAYEYLKDILVRYVHDKSASINKKEFASLIWRVDSEYVRRKTGDELARVISTMYEFFEFSRISVPYAMPIRALIKFFEDKGLTSVVSQLEGEIAQGRTSLTRFELAEVLEAVRRTTGAFSVEKNEANVPETLTPAALTSESQPSREEPAASPAFDFESIIDEGERKRFVKKIFKQDENAYHAALQSLGAVATWKQASKFIDEVFIQNDVDPYTSEAERFVDIVFEHYNSTK